MRPMTGEYYEERTKELESLKPNGVPKLKDKETCRLYRKLAETLFAGTLALHSSQTALSEAVSPGLLDSMKKMLAKFLSGDAPSANDYESLVKIQAKACLALFKVLPDQTQEDCAASSLSVGGVSLPDFLDHDIAKRKFLEAGIDLGL